MPLHNPAWEVAEPYLVATGAHKVADPTYGRYLLGHHPPTRELMATPGVRHTFRRIFLKPNSAFKTWKEAYTTTEVVYSEDVQLTPEEIVSGAERTARWIFYSVWEMDEPEGGWEAGGKGRGKDLVLVHGLSDYALRYAPHVLYFLKAGFRIILPDLASVSLNLPLQQSRINSYIPDIHLLPATVHAVLKDVVQCDKEQGRKQSQVFLAGALDYAINYPPTSSSGAVADALDEEGGPRVHVAGAYVLCPMVEAAKQSRPPYIVELLGKGVRALAGALPAVKGVRGNVSDDPRVEEDFFADPIRMIHGDADRCTDPHATERLFARLPNKDKQFEMYPGYEHVMLKVGIDEADDEKRQRVLKDWRNWLIERCD